MGFQMLAIRFLGELVTAQNIRKEHRYSHCRACSTLHPLRRT
jgi:hypothetical protein